MYSESIYKMSKLLEQNVLIYWESLSSSMGYADMRVNKSRVHTRIINSGLEKVNSMKLLLYGGQSQGYKGD